MQNPKLHQHNKAPGKLYFAPEIICVGFDSNRVGSWQVLRNSIKLSIELYKK